MENKKKEPRVRATRPFKLKDHPEIRRSQVIDLKRAFGFLPKIVIIAKMPNSNNNFALLAVLTEKEEKKDDERILKDKKAKEAIDDAKKRFKEKK